MDLDSYIHHERPVPVHQDLAAGGLACVARRSSASVQHHLAAAVDTLAAEGSPAVVEDTALETAVVVDMDRGCRAVEEVVRMHRTAECSVADSGRAKPCAPERTPEPGY